MAKQTAEAEADRKKREAEEDRKKREQEEVNMRDPVLEVPPDSQKRTFNENDILGEFDRDEKGGIIVLQDDTGQYVDKMGRRVNERGYLLDPKGSGDIVENMKN